MATLYQKRKARLLSDGFLPFENRALAHFKLKSPYIRLMRRERRILLRPLIRQAKKEKWSQTKLITTHIATIKGLYDMSTWKISEGRNHSSWNVRGHKIRFWGKEGSADPFAMLYFYYKRTIKEQLYIPKKMHHKKTVGPEGEIDRAHVRVQATHYRAKASKGGMAGQYETYKDLVTGEMVRRKIGEVKYIPETGRFETIPATEA